MEEPIGFSNFEWLPSVPTVFELSMSKRLFGSSYPDLNSQKLSIEEQTCNYIYNVVVQDCYDPYTFC